LTSPILTGNSKLKGKLNLLELLKIKGFPQDDSQWGIVACKASRPVLPGFSSCTLHSLVTWS
jgi:hypothetical protein